MDHQQSVNRFTSADRWFTAIGRFVFEFSQLEYEIKDRVAQAIGLKEQHFDPIMSHDFARLCSVAKAVLLQDSTDASFSFSAEGWTRRPGHIQVQQDHEAENRDDALVKLLNECLKLNEDRNRVVHGLWWVADHAGCLYHVSRNTFKNESYFGDPSELAKKADQACNLRNEISKWGL